MQYLINGTLFTIEETLGGYVWDNGYSEGEYCATELESLQAAVDYVSRTIRKEFDEMVARIDAELFGSYDTQVRSHHNYITRH